MSALTPVQIVNILQQVGFRRDKMVTAIAIAYAESSGDPNATNGIHTGLWQISQVHKKNNPSWSVEWLKNPVNNARAMKKLSGNGSNWSAWEAYTGPDGKGSDGPWHKYEKMAKETPGVPGAPHQTITGRGERPLDSVLGEGLSDSLSSAAGDVVSTAEAARNAVEILIKAGNWLSVSSNWLRVFYVAAGGVLVATALGQISGVGKVVGMLPTAKVVKAAKGVVSRG